MYLWRCARRSLGAVFFTAVVASTVLSGCHYVGASAGRVLVVGAERQYADLLGQLGGRYVTVVSILNNANVDPHSFEATTDVAREISNARLIVQNGMGYDSFMNSLESATSPRDRHVISVQRVLGVASTANPHLWYRVNDMAHLAQRITNDLTQIDRSHGAYFAQRLARMESSLNRLRERITHFASSHHGVRVEVTEPVANYLVSELGIHNVTPRQFQLDVMNGVDPAPQDVQAARFIVRSDHVNAVLYNEQVVDAVTTSLRTLALSANVPVVAMYEIMPAHFHYQGWMRAEIDAIVRAIVHHASTEGL